MGPSLCHGASVPDQTRGPIPELRELCLKDFNKAAAECDLQGAAVLLDAKGRFTLESKPCYHALGEVLRNVARMSATSAPCCRCAVVNRCISSAHACFRYLAEDPPVLPRCAPTDCFHDCHALLPQAKRAPQKAPASEAASDPERLLEAPILAPGSQSPSVYPPHQGPIHGGTRPLVEEASP
ncbi:MAG: hypothetical protein HY901_30225 [Deltaproteobacteria bacterium]|nr:hypothetical protein [Deltaproteobacteria bacterium]